MTGTHSHTPAAIDSVLLPVGVVGGLLVAVALFVGGVAFRELAWPWTDRWSGHGWFHCVNETGLPIAWGWRDRGCEGWNYVGANWSPDPEPGPSCWQAGTEIDGILPGVTTSGDIDVLIRFPKASGVPAATTSFRFRPGLHVRLRVASDHHAYVALGSATSIGYATFGPEGGVGGP